MFINNFDPVAIEILTFEIRWYSLAYITGILIGWILSKRFFISNVELSSKVISPENLGELIFAFKFIDSRYIMMFLSLLPVSLGSGVSSTFIENDIKITILMSYPLNISARETTTFI